MIATVGFGQVNLIKASVAATTLIVKAEDEFHACDFLLPLSESS